MQSHAESIYPEECCGILIGTIKGDIKSLIEVIPTENSWDEETAKRFQIMEHPAAPAGTRRNRFSIAPEVMLKAQKQARDRNLDIIGIYHSHPDHPAIPSESDLAIAWSQYSYMIISVQQGVACDVSSWSLDPDRQFQPEEIILMETLSNNSLEAPY